MAELEYDVVFFDSVSSAYQEDTPNHKGLGGSETLIITLSQELVNLGFSVLVLNDPISQQGTEPSPENPIVAKSGVHYASCRCPRPTISCAALIGARYSTLPPDPQHEPSAQNGIKRDRAFLWIHDPVSGPGDPNLAPLVEAVGKRLNKGGAAPIFTSEWSKSIYPPQAIGRYSRLIPNLLPRIVFDEKWKTVPQEDFMMFASAAIRGLDATLKVWSEPKIAAAGKTVLEIVGPNYDPPPDSETDLHYRSESLKGRIRLGGSLTLPQLIEHMASSRGLVYACVTFETFCLTIAYMEALGRPARFAALSRFGFTGAGETLQHKQFLYGANERERFVDDLAAEIASGRPSTVEPVRKYHPDNIMPMWMEALGFEA